jgi:hypothetical protein
VTDADGGSDGPRAADADADADADASLFDYAEANPGSDATSGEDEPCADGATGSGSDSPSRSSVPGVEDLDWAAKRRLGVELIEHVELSEPRLAALIDRIETVTTNPTLTREILDEAEKRGLIERDGARVRTHTGGTFVRFERQVVRREGEFDCRRCGASLSTGHFVRLESGELGPFGSSCVRKVTGRES